MADMEEQDIRGETRTLSSITILAGIWLIIAPFILNYNSGGNRWQEIVFGIIVGILGIVRLAAVDKTWPSWINTLIGLWLIIAPWAISNTSTAARWNEVIVGIIVAVFAYSSGAITANHRGDRYHAHQH